MGEPKPKAQSNWESVASLQIWCLQWSPSKLTQLLAILPRGMCKTITIQIRKTDSRHIPAVTAAKDGCTKYWPRSEYLFNQQIYTWQFFIQLIYYCPLFSDGKTAGRDTKCGNNMNSDQQITFLQYQYSKFHCHWYALCKHKFAITA